MQKHSLLTAVHRPYAGVYADATERLAATGFIRELGGGIVAFAAEDLYKKVLQLDNASEWVLTAITPTWVQVGGPGVSPGAHAASHQNGGSDEISVAGLSGVLADPQFAGALVETSGPTVLVMDAVADGEFLKRAGSTIVGDTPAGGGGGAGSVTVAHLGSDVPNSTTTAAKITALDTSLAAGTYVFQYYILFQVALTSTGVKFSANFTGTHSSFNAILRYVTAATTSVSDIADGDSDGVNGSLYQVWSRRAASTAANMGPTNGTDAANADCLWILEGLLIATGSGNIELYHASDAAADSTVKAGTSLILTKIA